jgi:plastocyanin
MRHLMLTMLVALMAATPSSPSMPTVTIKDDAFAPARLTISAGQTVTFVNQDDDAHTVTSTSGWFDSKGLDTNGVWRHTFSKAGTYAYFCELHPFMKGTIVVQAVKP